MSTQAPFEDHLSSQKRTSAQQLSYRTIDDWRSQICGSPQPSSSLHSHSSSSTDSLQPEINADESPSSSLPVPPSEGSSSSSAQYPIGFHSLGFRRATLLPSGINLTETKPYGDVFPATTSSHVQQLQDATRRFTYLPFETSFVEISQVLLGTADEALGLVSQARIVVQEALQLSEGEDSKPAWQPCWHAEVYKPLNDGIHLALNQAWKSSVPKVNAGPCRFGTKPGQLQWPVPDIAMGFELAGKATAAEPPFLAYWREHSLINEGALLSLQKGAQLHPERADGQSLVYPCFVHEVQGRLGSLGVAANQLAGSLAFALDQQEELRRLAGASVAERMPVFGAVSAGFDVRLWCAAYVGDEIHMVNFGAPLALKWPAHACALIKFTQALRTWMLSTYAPRITAWLDALWLKTRSTATADRV